MFKFDAFYLHIKLYSNKKQPPNT